MTKKEKKEGKKKDNKQIKKLSVKTGVKTRTINVDYLARVEGEGALYIEITDKEVTDVKLKIFEPPRFFEAFLRGRGYEEVPDITARICGICPVAYQMSALYALENAFQLRVPEYIHQLRRLMYCGEWIESHALHVYMLHAPDFLHFEDAVQMSKQHPEIIKQGLMLKKWGNAIIKVLGGREIHPINVRVGGFYKIPDATERQKLLTALYPARDTAFKAIEWFGKLNYPELNLDYEFVALSHPTEYAITRGKWISNKGLDIDASAFESTVEEFQVKHSTALQARLKQRDNYFVGPMARYNLNRAQLSPLVLQAAAHIQFEHFCTNPFRSIIIRSLEILYAFDEAIRILESFQHQEFDLDYVAPELKNCVGFGITEAPRGSLYHRYQIAHTGDIEEAKIIPPTSQNQYTIEKDLTRFVKQHMHLGLEKLTWHCEQAIRNYDPCISCSTHFLKVHIHDQN